MPPLPARRRAHKQCHRAGRGTDPCSTSGTARARSATSPPCTDAERPSPTLGPVGRPFPLLRGRVGKGLWAAPPAPVGNGSAAAPPSAALPTPAVPSLRPGSSSSGTSPNAPRAPSPPHASCSAEPHSGWALLQEPQRCASDVPRSLQTPLQTSAHCSFPQRGSGADGAVPHPGSEQKWLQSPAAPRSPGAGHSPAGTALVSPPLVFQLIARAVRTGPGRTMPGRTKPGFFPCSRLPASALLLTSDIPGLKRWRWVPAVGCRPARHAGR